MVKRSQRQELILTVISDRSICTQEELLKELARRRVVVTQSTLSRELKALGVGKGPDGRGGYRYLAGTSAGEEPLTAVAALMQTVIRAQNLLVLKTPPGNASAVAEGIDQSEWSEVLGTIAGDNTILVICGDERKADRVEKRLKKIGGL